MTHQARLQEVAETLRAIGPCRLFVTTYVITHGRRLLLQLWWQGGRTMVECVDTTCFVGPLEHEPEGIVVRSVPGPHEDEVELSTTDGVVRIVCGHVRLFARGPGRVIREGLVLANTEKPFIRFGGARPEVFVNDKSGRVERNWVIRFSRPVAEPELWALEESLSPDVDGPVYLPFAPLRDDLAIACISIIGADNPAQDERVLKAIDAVIPISELQGVPREHWRAFRGTGRGPLVG